MEQKLALSSHGRKSSDHRPTSTLTHHSLSENKGQLGAQVQRGS